MKPAPRFATARALLVTAGLLAAMAASFHAWRPADFVLTAVQDAPPAAPLYAAWSPEVHVGATALAVAILAAGMWVARRVPAGRVVWFLVVATIFAFCFRLAVHAGRDGAGPGRELVTYAGEAVYFDVERITTVRSFLGQYPRLQPGLSLHGRTKPPGFALLLHAGVGIVGPDPARLALLLTALASLLVVPAFALGRWLGDEATGRTAGLLAATVPSAVVYGCVTLDAVFAVLAGTAVAVSAAEATVPSVWRRVALGALFFILAMLSYSAALVGALCVLVWWRGGAAPAAHRWRAGAEIAGVTGGLFVGLRAVTGFDPVATFANALGLNRELMTAVTGRDLSGFDVWSYTAVGNPLAFALGLGVPCVLSVALMLRAVSASDRRSNGSAMPAISMNPVSPTSSARVAVLAAAFALCVAAASVGGLYLLETERIWLYFVPVAVALAARAGQIPPALAVGLCGLQAIVHETLLFTLW